MRATFWTWPKILEAGRQNGWVPAGTVLEDALHSPAPERGNYEPDSYGWHAYKVFTAEDAANLADALERAGKRGHSTDLGTPALIGEEMKKREYDEVNGPVSKKFIDFLRQGSFTFINLR